MGRRSLLLLVMLVPALTACAVPGTDAAEADNCADSFLEGVRMGNPGSFDEEDVKRHVRPVCEAMVEAGLSDESSEGEVVAFLQKNPGLAGQMCEASATTSQIARIVKAFDGYVTSDDVVRLGRDTCVYSITEGRGSFTMGFDLPAVMRAHPYLGTPFCRAPLMQAYDSAPTPQRRKVYEDVVTEVCMEAIRSGVIDYSAGIAVNPDIDQKRFRALLRAEWAKRS